GFNRLKATCSSRFAPPANLPPAPEYIEKKGFGIVQGRVEVWLIKLPPAGETEPVMSLNKTLMCNETVSDIQPEDELFRCGAQDINFDRFLEHGDILKIQFITTGGGFRDVWDLNRGRSLYLTQNFTGFQRDLSVEFRFDFEAPYHCGISSCSRGEIMLRVPDFSKTNTVTIEWNGWQDDNSKVYRYAMEVFKMSKVSVTELEIKPSEQLQPLINREVLHSNLRPQQYTFPEPGMYSVILEIADLANNTVYVRRLCLFDNTSTITTDPEYAFYVITASEAENHRYQNHTGSVRPYPPQLQDMISKKYHKDLKRQPPWDDFEGDRTVSEIRNKRAIVNFKVAHRLGRISDSEPPANLWIDLNLNTTYKVPENLPDAQTVTIWVKATDAMGNEKVEKTNVTIDSTEPDVPEFEFRMNTYVEGIDFSSTFDLVANDPQSGVAFVKWTFTRQNGTVIYNATVHGKRAQSGCDRRECFCTITDECFLHSQSFSLSNCHMMVEKENLATEVITVTADVTNMAGLVTRRNMTKGSLIMLNGTQAYYPPQNIQVKSRTIDSVTITWDYPPSCFARTGFWVIVNGQKYAVHVDATEYVISGLESGESYTIYMVTDFIGGEQSDKQAFVFTTEDDSLGGGAIAGIIIGLLILLALIVLIVVFVLYRRRVILQQPGPVNKQLNRMSHAFDNARRFTMKRSDPERAFSNNAYKSDEDEVYLYGHMAFNTHQNWQLADSDLTLLDHVAEGKFANIYKATWRHDGRSDTVAAKMLKPGFSEDDALKMMAKVNFFATAFDDHDNVIRFLGAVTDNTSWGPVLVMEYCECGQMDKWLASRRNNVDEQTMENMFRFSMGVAKGMEYLASKGITHRRLAARNILLTFVLDAKVAGFGPQHKEGTEDKMTRVPAKWAAPEVLEDKPPTEKSDVWSFGVVLWEIFSMGQVPYPNVHANQIGSRLKGGYRMDKPEFADDIHYDLMKECWQYKQSKRPTFKTVRARLSSISHQATDRASTSTTTHTSFTEGQIGHL
ncbi:hypothetical protein BaRGS_00035689, partial [Batillaria attramentaria]